MSKTMIFDIAGEINLEVFKELLLEDSDPTLPLLVRICSPGGDVDAGVAIYEYLRLRKGRVMTAGYGCVASIATLIFMAGDERMVSPGVSFLIHDSSVATDEHTHEKLKDARARLKELERLDEWYCQQMADRSGALSVSDIRDFSAQETFFDAASCVKYNLAHSVMIYFQNRS